MTSDSRFHWHRRHAATVGPDHHHRIATQLRYSETVFVDLPTADVATAHARVYTPVAELPFAGHPTVGASWWLARRVVHDGVRQVY